jgi:hypothetical protein
LAAKLLRRSSNRTESHVPNSETRFAERTFDLRAEGAVERVHLRVAAPEPDPAGGAWRCRIHLTGPGLDVDRYAYGEDGLQALILGLEMARVRLRTMPLPAGATLTWLGEADLGIPAMLPNSPVR